MGRTKTWYCRVCAYNRPHSATISVQCNLRLRVQQSKHRCDTVQLGDNTHNRVKMCQVINCGAFHYSFCFISKSYQLCKWNKRQFLTGHHACLFLPPQQKWSRTAEMQRRWCRRKRWRSWRFSIARFLRTSVSPRELNTVPKYQNQFVTLPVKVLSHLNFCFNSHFPGIFPPSLWGNQNGHIGS